MLQMNAFPSFGDTFLGWASAAIGRPEPQSAPNYCFSKLLGYVSGRGVGRQILAKAVRSPEVLQINAFLSLGDTFLGGASAARS